MIRFSSPQMGAFAEHLDGQALAALGRSRRITDHRAALLEARIKANAPVAEVDGGEYRDSWHTEPEIDAEGRVRSTVGTDAEEGFRKELGFHGTDSLGRNYTQDHGHPHVGPAADTEEAGYGDAIAAMVEEL